MTDQVIHVQEGPLGAGFALTMDILIELGCGEDRLGLFLFDERLEGTQTVTQALCGGKPQATSVRETDVTKRLSTVQLFL